MKKHLQVTLVPAVLLAVSVVVIWHGTKSDALATRPQQQDDAKTERLRRLKIEKFQGEAVSMRAKQLRKLHKSVARAMKDAEKAGLRPAFDQGVVMLGTDPDNPTTTSGLKTNRALAGAGFIRHASLKKSAPLEDYYQDGYEISFLSYDDGDPNTWEGIIYRNGPDIDEDTRYAVIDIHIEEPQLLVDSYYPPSGGDPEPGGGPGQLMGQAQIDHRPGPIAERCVPDGKTSTRKTPSATSSILRAHTQSCPPGTHRCIGKEAMGCCGTVKPLDPFLKCSSWGAGAAVITCARFGPAWPGCWMAAWGAASFQCLRTS